MPTKRRIAPDLAPSHSRDVYEMSYFEPHIRKVLDSAYTNGMESLLGEMLSYAYAYKDNYSTKEGALILRFLKLFEPEVTRLGHLYDLDETKTPRRNRMFMQMRGVWPIFQPQATKQEDPHA